jgi:hypothetical protein
MGEAVNAVDVDPGQIAAELGALEHETAPPPDASVRLADPNAPAGSVDWDQALGGAMEMLARVVAPNWELEAEEKQVIAQQGSIVLEAFFPNFQPEQKWVMLCVFVITAGGIVMKRYDDDAGAFRPLRKKSAKVPEPAPAKSSPAGAGAASVATAAAPADSRERPAAPYAGVPG